MRPTIEEIVAEYKRVHGHGTPECEQLDDEVEAVACEGEEGEEGEE